MHRSILSCLGVLVLVACGAETEEGATHADSITAPDEVRVIVEPSDRGAALVAAITGATKSVHMTMYELSSTDVINALLARHKAGIEVKVVLNAKSAMSGPNPNQAAFTTLQSAGVPVAWSSSQYEFTHEKCVVLDGKTAWVMTMNASKTSPVDNREYLAIADAPDAVAEAEAQFAADFVGAKYTPSGPLLMSPVTMRPGLTTLIESATTTLDFEVEELNDPALATAFCAAVSRHVTVRGLLSTQTLSSPGQRALTQLKSCGVTMRSLAAPYIHAKAIVVDGTRAYVGSANFSTTSLDQNRELGLITTNPTAISAVDTALTADIGNGKAL